MDNQQRPGFRPGHEPEANPTGMKKVEVAIKNSQFIAYDKYGKILVTVSIDGKDCAFCGTLDKNGKVKRWMAVPTPSQIAPSLFDYLREHSL